MKTDEKITLWSERISEFHSSGQPCKAWCQEHHVPVSTETLNTSLSPVRIFITNKFVRSRVNDPNIIRLLERTLKSGILKDGGFYVDDFGAGQGGLCLAQHNPPYVDILVMPT